MLAALACCISLNANSQALARAKTHSFGIRENVSEVHAGGEIMLTVLADQIHVLKNRLISKTAMHYYSFTVTRGQSVLLASVEDAAGSDFWQVEYYDGGTWARQSAPKQTFSQLAPQSEILIRVSHRNDVPFAAQPYHIVFGSTPVLQKYEFQDEAYVNRIPTGHTEPSWFWTQGYTNGKLEALFTDSVGAPLKGATGRFVLNLEESRIVPVVEDVMSDENGKVSRLVTFDRCAGGHEARDYVSYYQGRNTWRRYYYVGGYTFINMLAENSSAASADQDIRLFGHICNQQLIKSVAG